MGQSTRRISISMARGTEGRPFALCFDHELRICKIFMPILAVFNERSL